MFRHRPGPLAALAASAVVPGAVLEAFGKANVAIGGTGHFALVSVAALVAGFASTGLTAAGVRRRDAQIALLGTAFSTMTALLAVHGLATPGVLVGPNGVVALAGGLSLPAGAAVLALTALPGLRNTRRMGPLLALQAALAATVLGLGAAGLLWPALVPAVPASGSRTAIALMSLGITLFGLLANRAMRTFALTRRVDDLLVAVGCAWLAVASFATLTATPGSLGFWLGHVLEITGVLLLGVPVARDLQARRRVAPARRRPQGGRGRRVRGGVPRRARARADGRPRRARRLDRGPLAPRRAAGRAGRRGARPAARDAAPPRRRRPAARRRQALRRRRRSCASPAPLTDEEYAEVKRHPEAGVRLLRELGGFPAAVHSLVGEHHERLDGAGYPAGLAGEQLAIGPRILAVCDVYDALVSDRVYREAWTSERALALLREQAGSAFDPACVQSLAQVVAPAPVAAGAIAAVAPRGRSGDPRRVAPAV